jgi:hypothetical protein
MKVIRKAIVPTAPKTTVLIRILVGAVFLSEGIQKFLFPESLGVGRFIQIGIPALPVMAPFAGAVEIIFAACVYRAFSHASLRHSVGDRYLCRNRNDEDSNPLDAGRLAGGSRGLHRFRYAARPALPHHRRSRDAFRGCT